MRTESAKPWRIFAARNFAVFLCIFASVCSTKHDSVAKGWFLSGQEVTSTQNQILPAGATLHLKDKFTLEAAVDSVVRLSQLKSGEPQLQLLYGTAIAERLDPQFSVVLLAGQNKITLMGGQRLVMQSLNANTRVLVLAGALAIEHEKNKWELSADGTNFFEGKAGSANAAKLDPAAREKIFPELARGKFLIAVK